MTAIHVSKIGDALGAEISGVDLAQPMTVEVFAEIRQAWLDHLVIRFREQRLSDPQLLAFSRLFGELDPPGPNPYGKPFLPEHPEMNVISNIKSEGVPIGSLGDGEAIWHTDMTYVEAPPMAAILYALEVPPSGGDTYWANMYLAYETLPAKLKGAIEGRLALHDATYNSAGMLRKGYKAAKPAANPCSLAGGATATSSACLSPRAQRCSTSCGRMPRSRSSPSGSSGARATYSSGTTAARCIGATRSIRMRAD